jgi:hypothetical protein
MCFFALSIMVAAAVGKALPVNPDAGLTDSQRQQIYSNGRDTFNARYDRWLASLDLAAIDYGALQRHNIMALYEPPEPSLGAAKIRAEVIALGNVRSIRPTAFDGTYVTLNVDAVIKGKPTTSIVLYQGGGLRPTPDWKGMFIADAMNAPLLLPGERAMVFLQRNRSGSLEIQSFTGLYRSNSGRVVSVRGNPFAARVDGTLERDFVAAVVAQP